MNWVCSIETEVALSRTKAECALLLKNDQETQ